VDSLRSGVRAWRLGFVSKDVPPLTLGVAGLAFLVAYGADLVARAYIGPVEIARGWFGLRVLEHGWTGPWPVLLVGWVIGAIYLLGLAPVASMHVRWWTRRRRALLIAIAIGSGGLFSNLAELLQKGAVTDFLLVGNLGDFSAGDLLMVVGTAWAIVQLISPDYVQVRSSHTLIATGTVLVSIIALPLIRPPLNHLPALALLLAGLIWLTTYFRWRLSVGKRVLGTLAAIVPSDPGPDTDQALEELEHAVQNSAHTDLTASARALAKLADAYARLERGEDLRRTSEAYLRTAEEVKSDRMKSWALDYLGVALSLRDDPASANRVWQESISLANHQGDERHRLRLLVNIGWAEVELDRWEDAQRTYTSALQVAERLGQVEMASYVRDRLNFVRGSESGSPEASR